MPEAGQRSLRGVVWLVAALLLPAAVLAFVPFEGSLAQAMLLSRDEVMAGACWRIFTGHWVHVSTSHFAWDALAFVALGWICARLDLRRFGLTMLLAPLVVSMTVVFGCPELAFYCGLSGIDAALFGLLSATMLGSAIRARDPVRVLLVAALSIAFVVKTGVELATASPVFVPAVDAVRPLPIAHLAGVAVGAIVGAVRFEVASGAKERKIIGLT